MKRQCNRTAAGAAATARTLSEVPQEPPPPPPFPPVVVASLLILPSQLPLTTASSQLLGRPMYVYIMTRAGTC
jgi:hypothetical protein